MDFIEKCILKKIYLYKVWRVHVQWTPPLLLYPPPLPALKWQFSYQKNVEFVYLRSWKHGPLNKFERISSRNIDMFH